MRAFAESTLAFRESIRRFRESTRVQQESMRMDALVNVRKSCRVLDSGTVTNAFGDCARAEPAFRAAAATGLPSADVYVGLATCLGRRRDLSGAEAALANAQRLEPENPVVLANLGILHATKGNLSAAIEALTRAIALDPSLLEARFNLALAYARAGRRDDAGVTARELLARLPENAPQRSEVERLLKAVK